MSLLPIVPDVVLFDVFQCQEKRVVSPSLRVEGAPVRVSMQNLARVYVVRGYDNPFMFGQEALQMNIMSVNSKYIVFTLQRTQ